MAVSVPASCPQCEHTTSSVDNANRFCPQCRFPLMLVANKYRLLRLLSEGGFGNVYLAHHIHLIEDSARVIKVIRPEVMNQPGMETRFFREVRVTASLSQKNEHIVRIYDDFGEEPQLGFYYVMEHLEGHSLYHLLNGPFDIQQALHIFDQLCDAISEAHRGAVVHRDLKPDNIILLQKRQYPDFVKVLDFGIAKPLKGTIQTRLTQGALGTPFYMSPEQCLAKDVGPESDIYAMGVLLYELLAGKLPFDFEEDAELFAILHAHITQAPNPLHIVRPAVPFGLAEVVHKAMAKKPEDRYNSVEEFRQAAALFIDEDTPYRSLTSSSRLRALTPGGQTPSMEQSAAFPPGAMAPSPPPGTRSAPIPAIVAASVSQPVAVGSGTPSGQIIQPHGSIDAYADTGTNEWNRDDKVLLPGLTPAASAAGGAQGLHAPPRLGLPEDAATTPSPRPVDPRLSQINIPVERKKSKAPLLFFLFLLVAIGAGGTWYYLTQMPGTGTTTEDAGTQLAKHNVIGTQAPLPHDAGAATRPPPDAAPLPPRVPPRVVRRRPVRRRPVRRRPVRRRPRARRRRPVRRRVRIRRPRPRPRRPRPRPIKRIVIPPRRIVVPPRRVALLPPPRPVNTLALQNYQETGQRLTTLFKQNGSRNLQHTLARTLLQQYKKLSPAQRQLASTHLYQSIALIQQVRRVRAWFKRRRWMSNPYQTQAAEYRNLMALHKRYVQLTSRLYQYPLSRYYLCGFYFSADAKERMYNLLQDAVHAPLPPPGFRHSMLAPGTLSRTASILRTSALATYRKGIRIGQQRSQPKICFKNMRNRLSRLLRN